MLNEWILKQIFINFRVKKPNEFNRPRIPVSNREIPIPHSFVSKKVSHSWFLTRNPIVCTTDLLLSFYDYFFFIFIYVICCPKDMNWGTLFEFNTKYFSEHIMKSTGFQCKVWRVFFSSNAQSYAHFFILFYCIDNPISIWFQSGNKKKGTVRDKPVKVKARKVSATVSSWKYNRRNEKVFISLF